MFNILLLAICIAVVAMFLKNYSRSKRGLPSNNGHLSMEDKYNIQRAHKQEEVDRILDKINRNGINNLSPQEKALLDEYAKSL